MKDDDDLDLGITVEMDKYGCILVYLLQRAHKSATELNILLRRRRGEENQHILFSCII